jgi:hypothetical protein
MDKNYNQYKQDNYYLNKNFKRYFSYIIVSLVLSSFVCLLSGCKDEVVVGSGGDLPVTKQTDQSPSLNQKYFTPFVEFELPSEFNQDTKQNSEMIAYNNNLNTKDLSKFIYITVNKHNTSITSQNFFKDFVDKGLKDRNYTITCQPKTIRDIIYFEYVEYENKTRIFKMYSWDNGNGKLYVAQICGYESNRSEIDRVAQVFDNSIKFKQ